MVLRRAVLIGAGALAIRYVSIPSEEEGSLPQNESSPGSEGPSETGTLSLSLTKSEYSTTDVVNNFTLENLSSESQTTTISVEINGNVVDSREVTVEPENSLIDSIETQVYLTSGDQIRLTTPGATSGVVEVSFNVSQSALQYHADNIKIHQDLSNFSFDQNTGKITGLKAQGGSRSDRVDYIFNDGLGRSQLLNEEQEVRCRVTISTVSGGAGNYQLNHDHFKGLFAYNKYDGLEFGIMIKPGSLFTDDCFVLYNSPKDEPDYDEWSYHDMDDELTVEMPGGPWDIGFRWSGGRWQMFVEDLTWDSSYSRDIHRITVGGNQGGWDCDMTWDLEDLSYAEI